MGTGEQDVDDGLVTQLCHRYYQGLYYTQLQESLLVVLNPVSYTHLRAHET